MRRLIAWVALLLIICSSYTHAQSFDGIYRVEWCAEDGLKVDPGELVSACALIHNSGLCCQAFQVAFQAPNGWEVIPLDETDFVADPGASILCPVTIRAPRNCAPGLYPIEVVLIADDCDVAGDTLRVPVGSYVQIVAEVEPYPTLMPAGAPYRVDVVLTNRGNVQLPLDIAVFTSPECPIEVQRHNIDGVLGGFTVFLSADSNACDAFKQLINIKLINEETCETIWEHTAVTEILPRVPFAAPPVLRVPGRAGLYAGRAHGINIVGLEIYGGGIVDVCRERWIDYEIQLPSKNLSGVYDKIQVFRIAAGEPDWAVEAGDAVYGLSPLTERWRYGRGVHGFKSWCAFETGGLYISHLKDSDNDPQEIGGYVLWRPWDFAFVSCNYLHKSPIDVYPEADVYTMRLFCEPWECCTAEVEIGRDFGPYNNGQGKSAYRVGLSGRLPGDDSWFSLERVRAGNGFLGYYTGVNLTTANIDAGLTNCLRAGGSATWYKQNIGPPNNYLSALPDNRFYQGQLSYLVNTRTQVTLAGREFRLIDRSESPTYDLRQTWGDARICVSFPSVVATGSASLGQQEDHLLNISTWPLQVYSLNGCWTQSPDFDWNVLAETGNIQYYDVRKWRSAFGGGFRWRFAPRTCFECCANVAVNMPELCVYKHLTASLSHTRSNGHRIYVNSQYFSCRLANEPTDFRWFISYDVPFDVIIPQEIETGCVYGVVIDYDTGEPVENAVVSLSGARTLTDCRGVFQFPAVQPGCYELYADMLPQNYTVAGASKMAVTVRKGKTVSIAIDTVQVCRLQGRVVQYDLSDTLEAAEKFYLLGHQEDSDFSDCFVETGGIGDVRVTLYHKETCMSYTYRTTPFGYFRFDKLRPVTWTLTVEESDIPPSYRLRPYSKQFVLEPGDDDQIEIGTEPIQGQILSKLEVGIDY